MKFAGAATLLAISLSSLSPVTAWTFTDGFGRVYDGRGNKGCSTEDTNKGQVFEWDRGRSENCCIRLYQKRGCDTQVGFSCPDWKKTSSQPHRSFKVTDC